MKIVCRFAKRENTSCIYLYTHYRWKQIVYNVIYFAYTKQQKTKQKNIQKKRKEKK